MTRTPANPCPICGNDTIFYCEHQEAIGDRTPAYPETWGFVEEVDLLKPCPFCAGGRIKAHYIRDGEGLCCQDCSASVRNYQPDAGGKNIAAWNTRAEASVEDSDENVERLARAACVAAGLDPDVPLYPGEQELSWTTYSDFTRAILTAIREKHSGR